MRAIILAGGKGTRLRPYTVTFPKPLVPLGGEMPVMEIIIRQLARQGVRHVTLAVNHLATSFRPFSATAPSGDCASTIRWRKHRSAPSAH